MFEREHPLQLLARNTARCDAVTLAPVPPMTRIVIRADQETAIAIGDTLEVTLPIVACQSNRSSDRAALWLGPDEWLLFLKLPDYAKRRKRKKLDHVQLLLPNLDENQQRAREQSKGKTLS